MLRVTAAEGTCKKSKITPSKSTQEQRALKTDTNIRKKESMLKKIQRRSGGIEMTIKGTTRIVMKRCLERTPL